MSGQQSINSKSFKFGIIRWCSKLGWVSSIVIFFISKKIVLLMSAIYQCSNMIWIWIIETLKLLIILWLKYITIVLTLLILKIDVIHLNIILIINVLPLEVRLYNIQDNLIFLLFRQIIILLQYHMLWQISMITNTLIESNDIYILITTNINCQLFYFYEIKIISF